MDNKTNASVKTSNKHWYALFFGFMILIIALSVFIGLFVSEKTKNEKAINPKHLNTLKDFQNRREVLSKQLKQTKENIKIQGKKDDISVSSVCNFDKETPYKKNFLIFETPHYQGEIRNNTQYRVRNRYHLFASRYCLTSKKKIDKLKYQNLYQKRENINTLIRRLNNEYHKWLNND